MHASIGIKLGMGCFLLCTFSAGTAKSVPIPAWKNPEYAQRAVFKPPAYGKGYLVLEAPLSSGEGTHVAAVAYDPVGVPVPVDVIHSSRDSAAFLVQYHHSKRGSFVVYYGRTSAASPRTIHDPLPVSIETYAFHGTSVPNTWAKMLYLFQKARVPHARLDKPDIVPGPLHEADAADAKKRDVLPRSIMRLQTHIYCPTSGVFRFSVNCVNAGFLLIDGEMASSRPGIHPAEGAMPGPPRVLSEGLHRLEFYNDVGSNATATVNWLPPWRADGGSAMAIPAENLVCAHRAEDVRVEHIARTLHPSFTFQTKPSYAFRGSPVIYTPISLRDTSTNWISVNRKFTWRAADGQSYSGRMADHILAGNGPHRIELEVRDTLGFVQTAVESIDVEAGLPTRYPLEAVMQGLPAVSFAEDPIAPWLCVSGKVPATIPLEAVCEVYSSGGERTEVRQKIVLNGIEDARVAVPRGPAGEIAQIRWRLEHAGAAMLSATIRFENAPFTRVPVRLEEDRLYDSDGDRIILLPTRYGDEQEQPVITTARAFGTLLCVDDALAAPGQRSREQSTSFDTQLARIVDGPDHPHVRYSALRSWRSDAGAYGPLLKLIDVPALIDDEVSVVILCIGLQDILENVTVQDFERNIAALTDIITTAFHRPTVWATPPPSRESACAVRDYAAAIRRVADARHIPVADLYSAIRGGVRDVPLITDSPALTLTEDGHRLAANIIARALLAR
ncbi:MAG: SGNH/GDSL hydrolase family protein [Verrucomicrobia bacterium]|nr:SGNH/GDSL hydrolase family protein [Verrucomicrobiota bacterium]MDA1086491.1 SGNH/GDSL hydrolase family protein [Verrucomicrobiota bacterium]